MINPKLPNAAIIIMMIFIFRKQSVNFDMRDYDALIY